MFETHLWHWGERSEPYLSVRVERRQGGVQHAAPHLVVAVVQSVGDKEEEQRGDLRLVQVLGQLVQSQSDATPDGETCWTKELRAQGGASADF